MIFSNSCQYAIKSCIYLAVKQDKIDVTEISEFINSPVSFTSKILQKLAKSNIISSAKGRGGGFYLDNLQYQTTTIKDICEIFDNEGTLKGCILGLSKCNKKNPCPIHHYALEIRDKIKYILSLKICDVKDVGNIKFNL
jgi:Rrf2 family protein